MAIVSKSKLATSVYVVAGILGVAFALGLLGVIIWLLSLWANAHFFSFILVVAIIAVVALGIGLVNALDWASNVKAQEKADEQRAQYEIQEAKKMAAYKEKWGEDAVPVKDPHSKSYIFHGPPVAVIAQAQERNRARREAIG